MTPLPWLRATDPVDAFPDVDMALDDPPGLLVAGGDLRPERILAAYRRGIFPWYSRHQPILWWSPDPRCILLPEKFHCSRSLAKRLRRGDFSITVNEQFAAVMRACGDPELRPEGSWIHDDMVTAYLALHTQGRAHSLEVWQDDVLVGGVYGVQLGQVFFGESMFSLTTDASKVALFYLCQQTLPDPIRLIDCQMPTPHLLSLGAETWSRADFLRTLARYLN